MYKGYEIPDGELPPIAKDVEWSDQVLADYDSFLESVEDYLVDAYNLKVYYRSESKDHSLYLGMLAKDDDDNILFNFDLKLRVSNHNLHRSKASQRYKKEERRELSKLTDGRKLRPIVKIVKVNNEEFDSYVDAIIYIDDTIDKVTSKM